MRIIFSWRKESFYIALLGVFILTFSLEKIWETKILGNNFLLPEMVFCVISPVIFSNEITYPKLKTFFGFAFIRILLLYISLVLLSFVLSQNMSAFGEFLASVYAFSILFLVYLLAVKKGKSEKILKFIIYTGLISSILSISGYVLGQYFKIEILSGFYPAYPLIGDTFRGYGLIRGPMIASDLMCISLLILLQKDVFSQHHISIKNKFFIIILSLGLLSTLTKSILILIGVILIFVPISPKLKFLSKGLGILIILVYLCMSHFLIKRDTPEFYKEFQNSPYSSNMYYRISENYLLVPTIYCTQKYISLKAGIDNFPFGIGGNCHTKYAQNLFASGEVEANVTLTPHSTYFGAFGELGIFGFLVIFALYYLAYNYSANNNGFSLNMIILFIVLSGVTMGNMNLRHHWVVFGLLLVFSNQKKLNEQ